MSLKNFLIKKLILFFVLTTLIYVAVAVLGAMFDPAASFGYAELLSPMKYALLCVLPSLVTYSRRELKPRQYALRVALQFLLTEGVMLAVAFTSPGIDTSRGDVVASIALSVAAVFALVFMISWLANSADAKRTNDELMRFKRLHAQE